MTFLKQSAKQLLTKKQHNKYDKELKSKNLTYHTWMRQQEAEIKIDSSIVVEENKIQTNAVKKKLYGGEKNENDGKDSKNARFCSWLEIYSKKGQEKKAQQYLLVDEKTFLQKKEAILEELIPDVILISLYDGRMNDIAPYLIFDMFEKNENIILIYGDEDVLSESGERKKPWFKPDWSPDGFLSCFYFGGLIAVRTDSWKQLEGKHGQQKDTLYDMLYELLAAHNAFSKREPQKTTPAYHIRQVLFHSRSEGYGQIKDRRLSEQVENLHFNSMVSIVIPSRDNTEVLFKCLDSLLTTTDTDYCFEIILVDNGSTTENRQIISGRVEQYTYMAANGEDMGRYFQGIRYLYQPMPFNFPEMCNLGAAAARGNMLLFLNDDMEIIQPDWMDKLLEKALLPYAGAVGAKLLYPASHVIQHAGITNLRVGPAHKLQFLDDEEEHYYGRNRGVHNVLAVTGACLMMKKSVFEQAGKFYNGLAVAFNDVDLCYCAYEQGYYNIVRNDVILYHYESLSRGKDGESKQKQLRLQKEKDILYERHQRLYGQDPFYHPYLTNDMLESEYNPAFHYQVTLDMEWSKAHLCTGKIEAAREDKCLVVGMECAMDIYKWKYGVSPQAGFVKLCAEDNGFYFQGYSFVIGADNACYKKQLLLKNTKDNSVLAVPIQNRYRQDIKNNLAEQLNVDLTGFTAKLRRSELREGVYQFGMLASDMCSRQRLVNWSNWVLEVKPDEQ